jgi:ribonucleotide monophosphatase NagD (HAD superfamily)
VLNGRSISHKRVPHIFVTNGGGNPEDEKAAILQRELEVEVLASELLCSHTPMKNLVTKYRNDKILVVGNNKRRSEKILTSYVGCWASK